MIETTCPHSIPGEYNTGFLRKSIYAATWPGKRSLNEKKFVAATESKV